MALVRYQYALFMDTRNELLESPADGGLVGKSRCSRGRAPTLHLSPFYF
jgi:hypothetical protein